MPYFFTGHLPHYQLYQRLAPQQLAPDAKVYCLDIEKTTLALEMTALRKKDLTLVSPWHYASVTAVPRVASFKMGRPQAHTLVEKHFQGTPEVDQKEISKEVSKTALALLRSHRFVLKASFLDVHPLEAYRKMCGYLLIKPDPAVTALFRPAVTPALLTNSFLLVPLLQQMRERFLQTSSLKLRLLPRREEAPPGSDVRERYLNEWERLAEVGVARGGRLSFSREEVLKWAFKQKVGTFVEAGALVEKSVFEHSHFGTWQ